MKQAIYMYAVLQETQRRPPSTAKPPAFAFRKTFKKKEKK